MTSETKSPEDNMEIEELLDEELSRTEKLTAEDVAAELGVTDKGLVRQSIQNAVTVLLKDPLLAGRIRRNELTDKTEIIGDVGWKRRGSAITDTDVNQIRLYLEKTYGLTREKQIRATIDIVSSENSFHPIRDYLNSLKWDGRERIRYLIPRYLGAEESPYVYEMTKLMMLGAINRVFHPGCKFEIMLCLVGGQGAGKSTLLRFLAIRDEWFTDDLRRLDDENVYRKIQGHWFIEMAEMLATNSAKSIELIKSFLSRTKETYKIPYETHPEDRPRQCIFLGSSNNVNFLPYDTTGNRRFAPIPICAEKAERHPLDDEKECRDYIIHCWAEAMEIYRSGNYSLTFPKELDNDVRKMQADYMPDDSTFGVIQNYLDTFNGEYVCAIQIYEEAFKLTYDPQKRSVLQPINNVMNQGMPGWDSKAVTHKFKEYGAQRAWHRKKGDDNGGFYPVSKDEDVPFH